MLLCASVFTYEIDDRETALRELEGQIREKITLLDNTVGVILCNPEFIASGVVEYVSERLPFDLAGATTSSQAVNGEAGELILTVFIMTSDDAVFKIGITGDLNEEMDGPVAAAYKETACGMDGMPKLAVIFLPLILKYAGDAYIESLEKVMPGVPFFGTIAIDDSLTFEESATICGGQSHKGAMPFILCYGAINPRFLIGALPQDKAMPYKGEVTKSNGPYVHEINGVNAYKYFEGIGFAKNGSFIDGHLFVPFVIDQKSRVDYDGIPVIRGYASFTEEGTAIFRGDVNEGSYISMLTTESEDILKVTRQMTEKINGIDGINGALLFPCVVRRLMTMRIGPNAELELAKEAIDPGVPFMMGYSGGEVCPTSVRDGLPANRFHNYSLVILVI